MSGMKKIFWIFVISLLIPLFWNQVPIISDSVHALLDPSVGELIDWNRNLGFTIIVGIFSLITILLQKFTVDNNEVRRLKEEQKSLQKGLKDLQQGSPEKLAEHQKKMFELTGQLMSHTMKPAIYTFIPFVLFYRWFFDYFTLNPGAVLGMNWIVAYIVISLVLSLIFRRLFKLP